MIRIVWQYDPERTEPPPPQPSTAEDARKQLEAGNRAFAGLSSRRAGTDQIVIDIYADDLGLGQHPDQAPTQNPFAAVLSCADARVPIELLFGQAANDIFVVRVAGNVLGPECIGSIEYALDHLHSVHQLVVLGHTGCGAVQAAAASYLRPSDYLDVAALPALRTIVDSLLVAARSADVSLQRVYGPEITSHAHYHDALVDLAVCFNAALGANLLTRWFEQRLGPRLGIAYGVYNLATRTVGLPAFDAGAGWTAGLVEPPHDDEQFVELARRLARSPWISERF